MVSGGNMANLVCFWAARAARAGWDVRQDGTRRRGVAAAARLRIRRDAHLDPEGRRSLRPRHRVDPLDSRRRAISAWTSTRCAARSRPTSPPAIARCSSSARPASVSTGAVDPLPAIAAVCREHGVWFHVDGAYGGFAAAAPDAPADLAGIGVADSVAVDPHKWLYAPLEAGCALVRDAEHLRAAFAYHPPYYHFEERRHELRRLRAAELARLPRAEGVAGAAAGRRERLSHDDRRRHPPGARAGRRRAAHAGARAADAGAQHHDVPLRAGGAAPRASASPRSTRASTRSTASCSIGCSAAASCSCRTPSSTAATRCARAS